MIAKRMSSKLYDIEHCPVGGHVSSQGTGLREPLGANAASVRPLPGVNDHVLFEVVIEDKLLVADLATELSCLVALHMLPEKLPGGVSFSASLTLPPSVLHVASSATKK